MKNLILLLIVSFSLSESVLASTSLGVVKALKGQANILDGKSRKPLSIGDSIFDGALVETSNASALVVSLNDGSLIKLGNRSRMRFRPPREKTGLELVVGEVFAKVRKATENKPRAKANNSIFKIRTHAAVAGVRGTEFFTSYGAGDRSNDVWLCVNEGEVDVLDPATKKTIRVKSGEGISVTKSKGISNPKPLPWTKKLNWNMDSESGDLENTVDIKSAYTDLLDQDYE